MADAQLGQVVRHLRGLLAGQKLDALTDRQLLDQFLGQRDETAFEFLMRRHAAMVLGVCRRVLREPHDAEDAFQAAFLVLARKAGSIRGRESIARWLYEVAYHLALKAKARADRRRRRERQMDAPPVADTGDEVTWRELRSVLDEELQRLPAILRSPLVLCYLEGQTRDEAARALGWTLGMVRSRLERGRAMLRRRLERRGLGLPAAFLALSLSGERVRASLWMKAIPSALRSPSPAVAALADAGLRTLAVGKWRLMGWGLASLLLAMGAVGAVGLPQPGKSQETASPSLPAKSAEAKKPAAPPIRTDLHGDPLPEGALARLGTVRWRHGFLVYALAYSPDGKKIAAVGAGRAITLWDAATGKELCRFPNRGQPHGLAFSPDGKMLATTDRPCHLWDVATGKELRQLTGHQNAVRGIAFSPDGKRVVTGSADSTIRLWDAATGKEQRRIDCPSGEVCRIAFAPDGKTIFSSSMDGAIHLWDPDTGKERGQLAGHKKAVWNLALSADGKHLASSSEDETIRVWDVASRRQLHALSQEKGTHVFRSLAFSPDGTRLASGHSGGIIRIWDVKTAAETRRWQAGTNAVQALAFSPDGKTLASGAVWECIRLWDADTGRERQATEEHRAFVDWVRFTPDGKRVVSLDRDRRLLHWEVATQTPRTRFSWTAKGSSQGVLSPDGETFAVASLPDFEVQLWDVRESKLSRILGKHEKRVRSLTFSPDGRLLASGGEDGAIHVWDVRDGNEVRQFKGLTSEVQSLRFSPDSKALACGIAARRDAPSGPTLRLWNLADGKDRCTFDSRGSIYSGLVFSPDGKTLASGDEDYSGKAMVRLWDAATGKEVCRHEGHREAIGALAFSPDGKLIASGCGDIGTKDNSVHVWEAATGRLIRRFEGHHSCVSSVAFSPDGLTVASGAGDSTILLWDISGRRPDGRWHGKRLTPREREACWNDLVSEDASKAYDAVWMLVAAPEQTVPFLAKHLHPVPSPDAKTIAHLLADLDSEQFPVRQKATKELGEFGDAIAADLRRALDGKLSLEMRRRIQQLLDRSRQWSSAALREHRAIQALEHIGSPEAREVLKSLAGGAPGARQTEEAKAARQRP